MIAPLKKVFPSRISLILTFIMTGIVHDLVTMAVRQDVAFLFTPWVFFLGIGVVLGKTAGMDIAARSWGVRAAAQLTYLGFCLALAILVFTIRGGGLSPVKSVSQRSCPNNQNFRYWPRVCENVAFIIM